MRTKKIATIIGLSREIQPVIESAVALLQSAPQNVFIFELGDGLNLPAAPTPETPRPWSELEAVLAGERKRRRCEYLIGVLNEPIENNWFSHTAYGKNVSWITAHDWEFYSDLPVSSFVAYDIVLNAVLGQLVRQPEDEAWLMGEVIHTTETRECISDLCAYKPDISRKIRSGKICPDCRKTLEARLGAEMLMVVSTLLETISHATAPTKPGSGAEDFPALASMERKTERLLKEARSQVIQEERQLDGMEKEKRELELKLRDVEHRQDTERKRLDVSKLKLDKITRSVHEAPLPIEDICYAIGSPAPFSVDRPGLHEEVERRFPFPIAYCFRSLRAELNPSDRWDTLFELYKLIIRYTVFALLGDLRQQQANAPDALKTLIQKLKFGYEGDWGKACMALLKHGQKTKAPSFFQAFLESLDAEKLHKLEAASKALVRTRNTVEHGFKGDKQGCQTIFDRHLPDVKNMLQFIEPLADYVLIRPVQIVDNVDGQCIYFSKIMAGSDPQFLPRQMVSEAVPQTVCQLLSPDGSTLTMHPWLHLNRCNSCLRDMVFVYDAVHITAGQETVVLREYPSNHEQRQPALVTPVKKILEV